jgi:hypothetical protein
MISTWTMKLFLLAGKPADDLILDDGTILIGGQASGWT